MKTFLAVPTRGYIHYEVYGGLQELASNLETTVHFQEGGHSIVYNRNQIAARFYASDADALFMVDDDVLPHPHAHRLVGHLDESWDVVSAAVPIWNPKLWNTPVYAAFKDNRPLRPSEGDWENEPVECEAVGTGCIVISRRVVEVLGATPFRDAAVGGQNISEDINFCNDAREAEIGRAHV